MSESRTRLLVTDQAEPVRVPRLFGTRALSERWGMSRLHIYKLHRAGRLRGVTVAGCLRFQESEVLRFLRAEGIDIPE